MQSDGQPALLLHHAASGAEDHQVLGYSRGCTSCDLFLCVRVGAFVVCASQVAASCIYIICRQDKKPFLLIDFSDALRINLFVLGAVFLELCVLFSLDDHPIMTRYVLSQLDGVWCRETGHE